MLEWMEQEAVQASQQNSASDLHKIAEVMRLAYCDRAKYLGDPDFSEVSLDAGGVPAFHRRTYEATCAIPRGETRTYYEIAKTLGASGATYSVAQAITKNPYMLIVPCHRVLEAGNYADRLSPYGGVISKRRLLALEGAHLVANKTLFEVLLPVARPRPST